MGIYSQYGIEYCVVLKNGSIIKIVPIASADNRLLESEYYKTRKEYYNNHNTSWHEKAINCDCELLPNEDELLNKVLNVHHGNVLEHGWYDAKYIGTSY